MSINKVRIYFLGWAANYDTLMVKELMSNNSSIKLVNLPYFFRFLNLVLNRLGCRFFIRFVTKSYLSFVLRPSSKDIIICKDDNFNRYIENISHLACKKVLVLRNIKNKEFIYQYKKHFDEVFSFDKRQCCDYKLHFLKQFLPITKFDVISRSNPINRKGVFYFLGVDKNRLSKLQKLKDNIESWGYIARFLVLKDRKTKVSVSDIIIEKPISYLENIRIVQQSDVLIEINMDGQSGLTLRALEALFLGKKLITNNLEVSSYDFYNENNILIVNDVLDNLNVHILENFLNKPIIPATEYMKTQYSPKAMLSSILNSI